MRVLNYGHYGFQCDYEVEKDAQTIDDKFKNHITKTHRINSTKEILANAILRKKS